MGPIILVVILLLLVLLVGPFLIPVRPLEDAVPPRQLADEDSQFIQVGGLDLHLKSKGLGEPVILLLHGFGASLYSWQAVMEPLSQYGTVIAYDQPGFGLTERPLSWDGQNPYCPESQVSLAVGLLDQFGVKKAILIGNSAGGTTAMRIFLAHPGRVSGLVLVDPAVYAGGGPPDWTHPLLATPQMRRLGPLLVRRIQARGSALLRIAWHNPKSIHPQTLELYQKPLKTENWDKALWEFTLANRSSDLSARLSEFSLPVLVITGDDDRIVPTAQSIRLSAELPNAKLVVIPEAGHVPHEEKPQDFMQAVRDYLETVQKDA